MSSLTEYMKIWPLTILSFVSIPNRFVTQFYVIEFNNNSDVISSWQSLMQTVENEMIIRN